MPKSAKDVNWTNFPVPQTPLQRENFIDKCTTWLVKEALTDVLPNSSSSRSEEGKGSFPFHHRTRRTSCSAEAMPPPTLMGLTRAELRIHTLKPCAFCDKEDGSRAMVSNPFSQKDLVLVCDDCIGGCGTMP